MRFAFIFDLDGTLFDSTEQITRSVDKTRLGHGYPAIHPKHALRVIGLSAGELFSDLDLSPSELAALVADFRSKLGSEILGENKLFAGALTLLQNLQSLGFPIGVATSKPQSLAELVVSNSPLSQYVSYVQGTDGFDPKPAPHVVLRCLSGLGVTNGLMVGDRAEDIQSAKGAGILALGVGQTAFSSEELLLSGADYVYDSLLDFRQDLQELLRKLGEKK